LIALFGGVEKFVEQLMEFFDYSSTVAAALDVSGLIMTLTSTNQFIPGSCRSGPVQHFAQPLLLGRQRGTSPTPKYHFNVFF
jgi:hypothetical protein